MGIDMSREFRPGKSYTAWGPFVSDDYVIQPVTYRSIVTAGIIFGLACVFAISASYIGYRQTIAARRPWKSLYIWMIWMEIAASVVIAIECLLYLLKVIRPSFWFYMSILLNWSIQIQLLLQIIVNRIRIILSDPRKGHRLMLATVIIVGIINVSVFIIWIPARLQISETWIHINNGWDRTEKVLYLVLDAFLNYYFIRVVKQNLIDHGLEKYNTLVRFNQYMIVISLLMDVMIIGAMSFPNGFVYAMFHPLAYLVKLNIEMSMAHLIKTIALDRSRSSGNMSYFFTFSSPSSTDTKNNPSQTSGSSIQQVSIFQSLFGKESNRDSWNIEDQGQHDRFTYAQRPISPHTRPPKVHQNSLSWVDQVDTLSSDDSDWVRSDSAHKESDGQAGGLRLPDDDEIFLQRPEPAVLAPKGPENV